MEKKKSKNETETDIVLSSGEYIPRATYMEKYTF